MKKFIMAILVSIALFPTLTYAKVDNSSTITNYNNIQISTEEYNKLLSMGYSDSQIMILDQIAIRRNLNPNSTLISKNVSYIKTKYTYDNSNISVASMNTRPVKIEDFELTKEQYEYETKNFNLNNAETNADNSHTWGYRTLTTYLYKEISSGTTEYRVVNVVDWDSNHTPSTRSFDISGITFANTSQITVKAGSQYAFQTYLETNRVTLKGEYKTVNYSTNSDHYTKNYNGYAISMNLVNDTQTHRMSQMSSYLEYTVKKSGSAQVNNLQFKGTYTHATTSVNLLDVVGFAMDPSKTGLAMLLLGGTVSQKYDSGNKTLVQMVNVGW